METMHAAGRRNLPPVPRPHGEADREQPVERTMELRRHDEPGAAPPVTDDFETAAFDPLEIDDAAAGLDHGPDVAQVTDRAGGRQDDDPAAAPARADAAPTSAAPAAGLEQRTTVLDAEDPAQHFVSRLRSAAADFATAAGAESAVVREAVPPARHRRSRCRLVLRYPGGDEADLTFLGSVGRPGTSAWLGFDRQIQQWLGTGQHREAAWLVDDPEAPDGVAVDVPAWLAAG